jgi:hypothetical protein
MIDAKNRALRSCESTFDNGCFEGLETTHVRVFKKCTHKLTSPTVQSGGWRDAAREVKLLASLAAASG